ncbi:MAG TPA: ion transporter [Flavobacteriales bacterium]|nr:ion transporter [Flavobacteriales bacterium]HIN40456.1 ion transporter [Flavobacteriales bacterium]
MTSKMKRPTGWRLSLYNIIFGYDSVAGKTFDIGLVIAIVLSILVVMLDSVDSLHVKYGKVFMFMEWFFTLIFTVEYIARILCVGRPIRYILSFYGIVDLLATLPTYLALIFPPAFFLVDIRTIRLLRIFRILKLTRYMKAATMLGKALMNSSAKITVFLFVVFTIVIIAGTLMYLIEGSDNGFDSIPESIYWAIVTLTTVGYGDIVPQSIIGRILASILMILGYGLIAVPTGIVGVELSGVKKVTSNTKTSSCNSCTLETHDEDAHYCKRCGNNLV